MNKPCLYTPIPGTLLPVIRSPPHILIVFIACRRFRIKSRSWSRGRHHSQCYYEEWERHNSAVEDAMSIEVILHGNWIMFAWRDPLNRPRKGWCIDKGATCPAKERQCFAPSAFRCSLQATSPTVPAATQNRDRERAWQWSTKSEEHATLSTEAVSRGKGHHCCHEVDAPVMP